MCMKPLSGTQRKNVWHNYPNDTHCFNNRITEVQELLEILCTFRNLRKYFFFAKSYIFFSLLSNFEIIF